MADGAGQRWGKAGRTKEGGAASGSGPRPVGTRGQKRGGEGRRGGVVGDRKGGGEAARTVRVELGGGEMRRRGGKGESLGKKRVGQRVSEVRGKRSRRERQPRESERRGGGQR